MSRSSRPGIAPEMWGRYQAKYYEKKRAIVDAFKDVPCKRCGIKYPPMVMDFHHREPGQKAFSIGKKVGSVSRTRLISEISKCDVLCANCHRMVDHEELNDAPPKELLLS